MSASGFVEMSMARRAKLLALVAGAAVMLPLAGMTVLAQDGGPGGPGGPGGAGPGGAAERPEFPPFAEVIKGLEPVRSTADGQQSMWTLYKRDRDARLMAELPRNFESQRIFIATTMAGGVPNAGIQLGETYAYWKRFDKRLALMEPNVTVRSTGDAESKTTEERLYTDRVLLDVPIAAMGPGGGPVIDLTALLAGESDKFFGPVTAGANRRLLKIEKAKAFPQNIEVAFEMPDRGGRLVTIYYSIRLIPERGSYQPRLADPRVGYFTTSFRDISKQDRDTQWVRYINRWNLEKRDPKLEMSPPKEPVVFYIEANTPVHYRRWVREGILEWNKAFEKVGIINAIEVMQQDAQTGMHMDKDPEDARYNFVRWTSANLGFAIGPSRVHPETGQILDADVVIDDGFVRGWFRTYNELLPQMAMTGYGAEVLSWLDRNPQWDPRVRLANPAERDLLIQQRRMQQAAEAQEMFQRAQAHRDAEPGREVPIMALRSGEPLMFGVTAGERRDGMIESRSARCSAILGKSIDVALMRTTMDAMGLLLDDEPAEGDKGDQAKGEDKKDEKKDDKKAPAKPRKKEVLLDGMPEWFVGPLLKDLVMHEVGHTLGLRHNFKASSIYSMAQINSEEHKGKKPITGSVMDYNPVNINFGDGPVQGDYSMISIGTYDYWAIEYGYTSGDLKPVLARVSEPELAYGTDEDVSGVDPRIKQFDMGSNPLDYADSTMKLVQSLRGKILERIVKDGDSWQRARDAYLLLLSRHIGAVRIAGQHLGGADLVRDRKGDPGNRTPITPTDVAIQRRALKFILENAFRDEAFGLSRALLEKMTVDKWFDEGGLRTLNEDPAWPIHDRILGVQSSALTALLNPVTLQRVFDNEVRLDPAADALTLPELIDGVTKEIFSELDNLRGSSARQPAISSLRRNLQREFLERMIDLTLPDAGFSAAYKPISNLVVQRLRDLRDQIDKVKNQGDPYTRAHLNEASLRITKALEAQFIYNTNMIGGGGLPMFLFGQPVGAAPVGQQPNQMPVQAPVTP